MTDLNHEARQLVRLGRGLGEPSDADVARVRSSVMRRVGVGTTVVAAGGVVSKAASAARVAFLGSPLATKVVAVTALVSASVAGGVAYQARGSRSSTEQPVQAAPSIHRPAVAARPTAAEGPRAAPSATQTEDIAEREVGRRAGSTPALSPYESIAPVKRDVPAVPSAAPLVRATEAAPVPMRAEKTAATGTELTGDVAALREAQAALLAGHAQQAIDVGARVRADGPLGAEREGLLLVAQCSLGTPGALGRARDFAQRHAGSPLALRVQRACKLDDDDFPTNRGGDGHP